MHWYEPESEDPLLRRSDYRHISQLVGSSKSRFADEKERPTSLPSDDVRRRQNDRPEAEPFPEESSDVSSNLTDDNIPGTGRTIDMYFYQPAGRLVEKVANWFSLMRRPLHDTIHLPHPSPEAHIEEIGDKETSNSEFSTATATDNPGPGRIIDKCVYQRLGRRLEATAGKLAMRSMPSSRLVSKVRYLWRDVPLGINYSEYTNWEEDTRVGRGLALIETTPHGLFVLSAIKLLCKRYQ